MRAVGTFGLAKKDVSRENKKKHRTKKKEGLVGRAGEGGGGGRGGGQSVRWAPSSKGEQIVIKSEDFAHTTSHFGKIRESLMDVGTVGNFVFGGSHIYNHSQHLTRAHVPI